MSNDPADELAAQLYPLISEEAKRQLALAAFTKEIEQAIAQRGERS